MSEQRTATPLDGAHDPVAGPQTPKEAIGRMCKLVYEVHDRLTRFEEPCDCFCPGRWKDESNWRADERTFNWIERVVREALAKEPIRER